jgi:hypothetical protein
VNSLATSPRSCGFALSFIAVLLTFFSSESASAATETIGVVRHSNFRQTGNDGFVTYYDSQKESFDLGSDGSESNIIVVPDRHHLIYNDNPDDIAWMNALIAASGKRIITTPADYFSPFINSGTDPALADQYFRYNLIYSPSSPSYSKIWEIAPSGGLTPTGSLSVTITPLAALDAGAQWQVDGGTYNSSGATVSNFSVGSHTVSFKPVAGWAPPPTKW